MQPLFSKPIGSEVWVLLIEKAWAKLIGSYYAAELMTPDQFMEDLTGYPTLGAFFRKKKDPLKDILECLKLDYPIVVTSSARKMEGIVSNHSYSLMRVHELEEGRIYRLRNPWGRFEWNGRYGEHSKLWTPDLKLQCEWVEGDDGIFFLSEAELLEAFEYYSIGFQELGFKYSFLELKSRHRENIYLRFKHAGGKMAIRFSQPFRRMVKNSDYRYSGLVF
jgi:calpain-15